MDLYREEILEHWRNPQNFGEMKKPDVVIEQVNPLCGDEVTFYFKLANFYNRHSGDERSEDTRINKRKDSGQALRLRSGQLKGSESYRTARMTKKGSRIIKDVRFTGSGCAISIASASILSENIKGKSVEALSKITGKDVLKLIGGTVTPARLKCAFLGLEAVRKLRI